jgi:hypothetical protein
MLPLRVLSRSALVLALVAACSSSGSATTAPTTPAGGGGSTPVAAASTPAGPAATAPGTPGAEPVVPPAPVDPWVRTATELKGRNGQKFAYPCPPNGTPSTIWGTDTYTDDSSVCTAGVHAGVITFAGGGYVVIQIEPGQDNYTGTARNGVTSNDYASWGGSYVVIKR